MSDLISRETAVAILRAKADMSIGEVKNATSFFNHCANIIEKLPAVDAEPVRHGKWIKGDYVCGDNEWKCSVCGETEWRGSVAGMKFCMCCGAKMDGGEGRADVTQVVRCRDCVCMGKRPPLPDGYRKECGWCMLHGRIVLPEDYCSNGERMGEE